MMDVTKLVSNIKDNVGLWCPMADDDIDLARMAESASRCGVGTICVVPSVIGKMWPWLERDKIKIIARFYVAPAKKLKEDVVSDLVKNIKAAFKSGAAGAQVFVPLRLLTDFANEMRVIRDDLFFNRDLVIGLDIGEIGCNDWQMVFDVLIDLRVDSLLLVHTIDAGDKSDFPGRVYAMLDSWNSAFDGDVCWMLNDNYYRFEQVVRLTRSMHPVLTDRTNLFVNATGK